MKIQLDTLAKTIKLENDVLLGDFFEKIMTILPNDSWKEFKLITKTKIEWRNPYPIIVKEIQPWIYPTQPSVPTWPWWLPHTICEADNNITKWEYNPGVYNIELQ